MAAQAAVTRSAERAGGLAAGPVDLGVAGGQLRREGRVARRHLVERQALGIADVRLEPALVDLEDGRGAARRPGSRPCRGRAGSGW